MTAGQSFSIFFYPNFNPQCSENSSFEGATATREENELFLYATARHLHNPTDTVSQTAASSHNHTAGS